MRIRAVLYITIVVSLSAAYAYFLAKPFLAMQTADSTFRSVGESVYQVEVRGYHGPIVFRAGIDRRGRYDELSLISSREHPFYAPQRAIQDFLDRLEGKTAEEVVSVDGISGATVTTDAIRESLAAGNGNASFDWLRTTLYAVLWLLTTLLMILRKRKLLLAVGGVWFITIGVLENSLLTIFSLLQLSSALMILPLAAVVSALLYRNVYCRHVCPFGTLQALLNRLPAEWIPGMRRLMMPPIVRAAKYFLLGTALLGTAMGSTLYLEPYAYLFSRRPLWWLYLFPAFLLVGSFFAPRLWCRGFCPLGALLEWGEKLRQWGLQGVKPRWGIGAGLSVGTSPSVAASPSAATSPPEEAARAMAASTSPSAREANRALVKTLVLIGLVFGLILLSNMLFMIFV